MATDLLHELLLVETGSGVAWHREQKAILGRLDL
jgi:hypothetical protein